jgi:hypothetical protein
MTHLRPNPRARGNRRRAPRPLTTALVQLLRAHRPPPTTPDDDHIWICLSPATAAAIARISARRDGFIKSYRKHPAHEASQRPIRVAATTAAEWRQDALRAAGEGLIDVADALALCAQIDPSGAA